MSEEKQFLHIYGDPVVITDEDLRALNEESLESHQASLETAAIKYTLLKVKPDISKLDPPPPENEFLKEGDTESRVKNEESLR